MGDYYVFDTSAVLTYLQNEEGADVVELLLLRHANNEIKIAVSVLSLVELRYKLQRQYNLITVDKIINDVLALNLQVINFDMSLVKLSATYKSSGKLSFADACIASTAKQLNAILVHKDPEYGSLMGDVKQLALPFKPKQS